MTSRILTYQPKNIDGKVVYDGNIAYTELNIDLEAVESIVIIGKKK